MGIERTKKTTAFDLEVSNELVSQNISSLSDISSENLISSDDYKLNLLTTKEMIAAINRFYVSYSFDDGTTWNQVSTTLPTNSTTIEGGVIASAFKNGRVVAIERNGWRAYYSDDLVNWTTNTISSTPLNWQAMAYGNEKFIAVASGYPGPEITYGISTDGITWTVTDYGLYGINNTGLGPSWGIVYGNSKFVLSAKQGWAATTTDGVTWTLAQVYSSVNSEDTVIAYGDGKFVNVVSNYFYPVSAYSTNGTTWTKRTLPPGRWGAVAYGNGRFVVAGTYGAACYSTDAITWTQSTLPVVVQDWQLSVLGRSFRLSYAGNYFIFTSPNAPSGDSSFSTDGVTWEQRQIFPSNPWAGVVSSGTMSLVVPQLLSERIPKIEEGVATKANALLSINAQTGTAYTLVLADAGKVIEMNNASANTLTVPPNSSVAFPVGTKIDIVQTGAGETSIAPGSGVTLNSDTNKRKINAQWAAATLIKRGTDTWALIGALKA